MMAPLILLLCFLIGIGVAHLLIRRSAPWVAAWLALSGFGVAAVLLVRAQDIPGLGAIGVIVMAGLVPLPFACGVLLRCLCGWAAFRSRHGDG